MIELRPRLRLNWPGRALLFILALVILSNSCGRATPIPTLEGVLPLPTISASTSGVPTTPDADASQPVVGVTVSPPATYSSYLPVVPIATSTPVPPLLPPTSAPPTPIPTPVWPEPISGQTASKLGLHVIRNEDYKYVMEFVRRVHPRVIKAVDEVGWLADVKAASPNTVTVGRFNGQEETWVATADPRAAASAYVSANLERYVRNSGVDYWEGWNEYNPSTTAQWRWYAEFEAGRACEMQAHGLRAAVGGFSVGWPNTYEQMGLFLPALEAAHRCGAILTLHEYNSPTFQCGVAAGVPNVIPGAPQFDGVLVGYNTLRYRIWYEGYLKPRGLGDLPLVISELGIQGLALGGPCNDPGGIGWKDYRDWWVQQGHGTDTSQAYVNLLAWYDAEMRKDPYVIGAAIFTMGALNASEQWYLFDLHDVLVPLAYYEVSQRPP